MGVPIEEQGCLAFSPFCQSGLLISLGREPQDQKRIPKPQVIAYFPVSRVPGIDDSALR